MSISCCLPTCPDFPTLSWMMGGYDCLQAEFPPSFTLFVKLSDWLTTCMHSKFATVRGGREQRADGWIPRLLQCNAATALWSWTVIERMHEISRNFDVEWTSQRCIYSTLYVLNRVGPIRENSTTFWLHNLAHRVTTFQFVWVNGDKWQGGDGCTLVRLTRRGGHDWVIGFSQRTRESERFCESEPWTKVAILANSAADERTGMRFCTHVDEQAWRGAR